MFDKWINRIKALMPGSDSGQEIVRVGDDLHYEGTQHGSVGLRYSLEFDKSAFKLDTSYHYANPSKAHMPGGDRQVVKCTLTCLKAGTFVIKEIEDFRGVKKVIAEHFIEVKRSKR